MVETVPEGTQAPQRRASPQVVLGVGVGLTLFMVGVTLALTRWLNQRNAIRQQYGTMGEATFAIKGQPAPEFALEDLQGRVYRLSELRGTPLVLNFWATWCPPCRAEMPLLEYHAQVLQGQVLFLAINYRETRDLVEPFVEELGLTYMKVLLDPQGEASARYNVLALPTTFFVDAEGIIRDIHLGALTQEQLSGYLDNLWP